MGEKRKLESDELTIPNKSRKRTALDDADPIYEEPQSDADYVSSDESSVNSDSLHETPATPISTTSAKYPSELKTHRCPFDGCTKAFNRPARLQEHLRSHNNERIFKCTFEECDKTFLRASHLNHHIKSAHTGVRDYVCDRPGCGKSFVTGSRLRRHLAAHDGRDKYRCTEYPPCNETFRKHSTLQKHIMTAHLKQKPFQCPHADPSTGQKCTMAFDTAGHLRAHESRIHTEKRFSCTECSQHAEGAEATFPTYALLQAHIRSIHPPRCPNCSLTCATSRELRRHLEVAHGDVSLEERKTFPCTVPGCDRSFTKKGNLTVHIRTVHQGEKRFVCGETDLSSSKKVSGWNNDNGCGKRYGSKLALEEHIRTAHLGYQNAKAERRQRLGITRDRQHSTASSPGVSALAALTGEGYAEETGRHIACLVESCPHRFHRDYDLWVHMSGKHHFSEEETRDLFLRRALLAHEFGASASASASSEELFGGIYGLEFDNDHSSYDPYALDGTETIATSGAAVSKPLPAHGVDVMMHDSNSTIPTTGDDMALIDPALAYDMMES
ncbi:C2H2-type zinc finger protein [Aspergillus fischeri NRRL 181]|uniref:C2H2 transcription factor (TFIIIA), putative n=1 Tax=Neosartorya fischeri (strain ATCC 1020 / DSM 3700 / CBS 544.65 / FGSC A1164 / JCM 1740 / NRRL 181 / WB 181) TaxID=331117 RepID=A1D4B2_NEOFI|nr:C2H2 transcription factor (TFIIIA), putative [Aspergillus fischeri NRRL 181]EAW23255.1 C2H2 transcription factor (TFIIIA), putative [Aspergillus fischeri NRRL 181]